MTMACNLNEWHRLPEPKVFRLGPALIQGNRSFWFIESGRYQVSFKDTAVHGLLFSERNGLCPQIRIGRLLIRVHKKIKRPL